MGPMVADRRFGSCGARPTGCGWWFTGRRVAAADEPVIGHPRTLLIFLGAEVCACVQPAKTWSTWVLVAARGGQHDPGAQDQTLRRRRPAHQRLQPPAATSTQVDHVFAGWTHAHTSAPKKIKRVRGWPMTGSSAAATRRPVNHQPQPVGRAPPDPKRRSATMGPMPVPPAGLKTSLAGHLDFYA